MIATSECATVGGRFKTTEELWAAAIRFCDWLNTCAGLSYDPYDIWGTRYGR